MDMVAFLIQGMKLVVILSAPALIAATVSGVLVSLLQSMMQVQDQTLPFGVKLIVVSITLALTARWIGVEIIQLANQTLNHAIHLD